MTVLRTARLELRPAGLTDLPSLLPHWNQPLVNRFLFDDQEVTVELATTLLTDSDTDFARHGYGLWKAYLDGEFVGVCGLRLHESSRMEIIYSLEPAHWGSGLATEAAVAVLDAGRRAGLKEILLEVDDGNVASHHVAERLGAVFEDAGDGLVRYVITADPSPQRRDHPPAAPSPTLP
ncbi:GNAT family N-acetyltransferase [Nonomuraea sp. NPDC048826]|uniref:GNAT family N-acetyltransferase n=1 Tax=Nonomuraea sp. NPDC048826 TaxID=3364347 RepID=UPI003714D289